MIRNSNRTTQRKFFKKPKRNKPSNRNPILKGLKINPARQHFAQKSTIPDMPEDTSADAVQLKRPNPESEEIPKNLSDPFLAFYDEDTQEPSDFDSVLAKLKEKESLAPGENIVYIGKGEFAVVGYVPDQSKKGKKKLEIRRKIVVESNRENLKWRDNLCFDLQLSYKLNTQPLSKLYTPEELEKLTRFQK